ncbi:MAG: hypothetical protein Q9M91_06385 [Candidatus Dojkabacteria bacterium]|nr:hypothetical protein [Candidatus Dojkabacteria bacterium]MDQ7021423.1 hypothetical protein [Candidatus Dojkabacteria bacterium]
MNKKYLVLILLAIFAISATTFELTQEESDGNSSENNSNVLTDSPTSNPVTDDQSDDLEYEQIFTGRTPDFISARSGFSISYDEGWNLNKTISEAREELTLSKSNHSVRIIIENYREDLGCLGLYQEKFFNESINLNINGVSLWRGKVEGWDGSPGKFGPYTYTQIVRLKDESVKNDGVFECAFNVGKYNYDIVIDLPQDYYDPEILIEIDQILLSIKWGD